MVVGEGLLKTLVDAGALSILNLCLRFKFSVFCCFSFSISAGGIKLGSPSAGLGLPGMVYSVVGREVPPILILPLL